MLWADWAWQHELGREDIKTLSGAGPTSSALPSSRSTMALFIHTRWLAPVSALRALASSARARSGSAFSNSSLNAASHTCH